jgi:hypothetical protein
LINNVEKVHTDKLVPLTSCASCTTLINSEFQLLMINMSTSAHLNLSFGKNGIAEFENTFRESIEDCFSERLEEALRGKKIIFNLKGRKVVPVQGWRDFDQGSTATIRVIQPSKKSTLITAIDSSAIHLAGTEEGALYSAKSGIVVSSNKQILRHFRIGPMLMYLTESSLHNSRIDHKLANLMLMDSNIARRLIRIRLERALQLELSYRLNESVMLIDGSLRPSIFENSHHTIKKVIETSTLNSNCVIGLCKSTCMRILDQFEARLKKIPDPACIDTDCIIKSLTRNTLGKNMLIKLGNNETDHVLRADICSANGNDLECLERLIGNDIIFRCYPESLRIAHHISTFTNAEISLLKGLVLRSYGVVEADREDTRRHLLGAAFT